MTQDEPLSLAAMLAADREKTTQALALIADTLRQHYDLLSQLIDGLEEEVPYRA
jgi:hypothetical protein